MKIVIAIACVLLPLIAISEASPQTAGFQRELLDFLDIIPIDKIRQILADHAKNDQEFQNAVAYIQSPQWIEKVIALMTKPSVKEMKMIIKEAGLNLELLERMGANFISSLNVTETPGVRRSFEKFINDLKEVVDCGKIIELIEHKLETSEYFKVFYDIVSSEKMHHLADKVVHLPEFHKIAVDMVDMDIDIYKTLEHIYKAFGWSAPKHNALDEASKESDK